jgi:hypothetical protein
VDKRHLVLQMERVIVEQFPVESRFEVTLVRDIEDGRTFIVAECTSMARAVDMDLVFALNMVVQGLQVVEGGDVFARGVHD